MTAVMQITNLYSIVYTYDAYDTSVVLQNQWAAFTGSSYWKSTYIQFFHYLPMKQTSQGCQIPDDTVMLKLRYLSDTTADHHDGWQIRSMSLLIDYFGTSIAKVTPDNPLKIYPSPSSGLFNLSTLMNKQGKIQVSDITGRIILQSNFTPQIDISHHPNGIYLLTLSDEHSTQTMRIIKE